MIWLVHALKGPTGMVLYVLHAILDKFGIYHISVVYAHLILNGMGSSVSAARMGKPGMKNKNHANAEGDRTGMDFHALNAKMVWYLMKLQYLVHVLQAISYSEDFAVLYHLVLPAKF